MCKTAWNQIIKAYQVTVQDISSFIRVLWTTPGKRDKLLIKKSLSVLMLLGKLSQQDVSNLEKITLAVSEMMII